MTLFYVGFSGLTASTQALKARALPTEHLSSNCAILYKSWIMNSFLQLFFKNKKKHMRERASEKSEF